MNTFKLTYQNGDIQYSGFNGTLKEAIAYWLGHIFPMYNEEQMIRIVSVEKI